MNIATLSKKNHSIAFSFVEMLVVIAIVFVILASAGGMFVFLRTIRATQSLNQAGQAVKYRLEEARSLTVASKNGLAYGVHLESAKVVLFVGPSYVAGASTNQTTLFDTSVTIPASGGINLTPAGSDVLFARITGAASKSGTRPWIRDSSARRTAPK